MLETNVSLEGVQRLKEMSLEHKPTNYTYSKKNLERKVTTLTLIIFEEKHILEKEAFFFFLHGKKVSRKF